MANNTGHSGPQYGSEVEPSGTADMYETDLLGGDVHDRRDQPASFTGGRGSDAGLLGGDVTNPGSAAPFQGGTRD